jgi:hypothetical protein
MSLDINARDALITYYGEGIINPIRLVAELVLENEYFTNNSKGRLIKKYITTMLEVSKRFSFRSRRTSSTGLSAVGPVLKKVGI